MPAELEPGVTTLIARAPAWQRVQRWPGLLLLVAGLWSFAFGVEPAALLFVAVGFWGTAEFWRGVTVTGDVLTARGRLSQRRLPLADVLRTGITPGRTLWVQARGRRTLVLRMAEVRVDQPGGVVDVEERLRELARRAGAGLDAPLEDRVAPPRPRTPLFGW